MIPLSNQIPLLGSLRDFALLREFLESVEFRETQICTRLGLSAESDLDLVNVGSWALGDRGQNDALEVLIRLFVLGETVNTNELVTVPSAVHQVLLQLGLLFPPQKSDSFAATVALYPIGGHYFVSDRWNNPDLSARQSFPDVVYPALTKSTREFLRFVPFADCGDFLEVCCGTGIAAIKASNTAKHIWASDITERSKRFAEFNVKLNGVSNVEVLKGDLFEPCGSQLFDTIVAHPPYMPVLRQAEIYYDGGEDGESLTRRIVQGLPDRLRPGGRFYCRTLGSDRQGANYEERVRGWLGLNRDEFDVAFFVCKNVDMTRFALDNAVRRSSGQAEVNAWLNHFKRLGISELLSGILVVQRCQKRRSVFTLRRSLSASAAVQDTEDVLYWHTVFATGTGLEEIAGLCPQHSGTIYFECRYTIREDEIVPEKFNILSDRPFLMDLKTEPWLGPLLVLCDGSRSIRVLYSHSQENRWIGPGTSLKEFGDLILMLESSGFLQFRAYRDCGRRMSNSI